MFIRFIVLVVFGLFIIMFVEGYIKYFCLLLRGEFKHNKELRLLTKKNIKKRYYSNKVLKIYVNSVCRQFKSIGYDGKAKFKISKQFEQKLKFSRFDDKNVKELSKEILNFLKLDSNKVNFEIKKSSSRNYGEFAGGYSSNDKKILLIITPYCDCNKIISVLAHEISHYILDCNSNKLKLQYSNEVLTDIVTVYLGFYDYLYKSYKEKSRIIYDGEFMELVDRRKLGYLAYGDVKYVKKCIKRSIKF